MRRRAPCATVPTVPGQGGGAAAPGDAAPTDRRAPSDGTAPRRVTPRAAAGHGSYLQRVASQTTDCHDSLFRPHQPAPDPPSVCMRSRDAAVAAGTAVAISIKRGRGEGAPAGVQHGPRDDAIAAAAGGPVEGGVGLDEDGRWGTRPALARSGQARGGRRQAGLERGADTPRDLQCREGVRPLRIAVCFPKRMDSFETICIAAHTCGVREAIASLTSQRFPMRWSLYSSSSSRRSAGLMCCSTESRVCVHLQRLSHRFQRESWRCGRNMNWSWRVSTARVLHGGDLMI